MLIYFQSLSLVCLTVIWQKGHFWFVVDSSTCILDRVVVCLELTIFLGTNKCAVSSCSSKMEVLSVLYLSSMFVTFVHVLTALLYIDVITFHVAYLVEFLSSSH